MQKVRALTNFDGHLKGAEFELPPAYAKAVVEKGLAKELKDTKAAPAPENKMDAEPENKRRSRRASGGEE